MRRRFSIAGLLAVVLFFALILAGLRSGSNDWFKLIYTLTFVGLVFAAIGARYRGPFWHGFAVAGWAYFLVGFAHWGSEPFTRQHPINRSLISSFLVEIAQALAIRSDPVPPNAALIAAFNAGSIALRAANRDGITHCALTILFAFLGALVAARLARRPATDL